MIKIIILLFLIQNVYSQQEPIFLDIGQTYDGDLQLQNGEFNVTKFYQFQISNKIDGQILSVMVRDTAQYSWSDPDIYISSTELYPNSRYNSEYQCENLGDDVCTIPPEKIQQNETFYIGVLCWSNCSFDIKIDYRQEYFFQLGQNIYIEFGIEASVAIKIYVPEESLSLKSVDIWIDDQTAQNDLDNSSYKFYVNEGNDIPSSSKHDFRSIPIWGAGTGVSIRRSPQTPDTSKKYLQTNQNYTILLEASQGSFFILNSWGVQDIETIYLDEPDYEILDKNENITLKLTLSDYQLSYIQTTSQGLEIEVLSYTGHPDILIQYGSNNQYDESHKNIMHEIFPLYDLQNKLANETDIFVTVFANQEGSSFSVTPKIRNLDKQKLSFNEKVTAQLKGNEISNYRLTSNFDANITITLQQQNSNYLANFYVKKCDNKNDCLIKQADLVDQTKFIGYTSQNSPTQIFKFQSIASSCDQNKCHFAIAVVSNSDQPNDIIQQYYLLAHDQKSPVKLLEQKPHHAKVSEDEYNYYVFSLFDIQDVQKVTFQVTTISGQITAYSSRVFQHPNQTNYDKTIWTDEAVISYEKSNLDGNYYISVKGDTESYYSINCFVFRLNQQFKPVYLDEGIKQNVELVVPNQETLFKFDFYSNQTSIVFLDFTYENQSYFTTYINTNNQQPSIEQYQMKFLENQISFNVSKGYSQIQALVISQNLLINKQYSVLFYTNFTLKMLLKDKSLNIDLPPHSHSFYKFMIMDKNENYEITRIIDSSVDQIRLYISLNQENPYPTDNRNCFEMIYDNIIRINVSDFENYCPFLGDQNKQCFGYIAIQTLEQEAKLSLLVKSYENAIQLSDKTPVQSGYPSQINQTLQFYYYLKKKSPITVSVNSVYDSLKIFANIQIIQPNQQNDKNDWIYPDSDQHQYKQSDAYGVNDLSLPSVAECVDHQCVLLLGIQLINNQKYTQNKTFTLQVSDQIFKLQQGIPKQDYVAFKEYKYYEFEIYNEKMPIIISVTQMGKGDPDLFVNHDKNLLPIKQLSDYQSQHYQADVLEIQPSDYNNSSLKGKYVVGVYGYMNTTYEISFTNNKQLASSLSEGIQQQIQMNLNETKYFKYSNFINESIKIIFNQIKGDSIAYINTYDSSKDDYVMRLPSKQSYQWIQSNELSMHNNVIIIDKNDQNYCINCEYLIAIKAKRATKTTILLQQSGKPIYLQTGHSVNQISKQLTQDLYRVQDNSDKNLIKIQIYSGNLKVYISSQSSISTTYYENQYEIDSLYNQTWQQPIQKQKYILIDAITDSYYKITEIDEDSIQQLKKGSPIMQTIESKQTQVFLYSYFENNQEPIILSLFYFHFQSFALNNLEITIQYTSDTKNYYEQHNLHSSQIISQSIYQRTGEIYKISPQNAEFIFKIKNPLDIQITYQIAIQDVLMNVLQQNAQLINQLNYGEQINYEIFASNQSKLLLEIFECKGHVKGGITLNQTIANNRNLYYYEKKLTQKSAQIITVMDVNPGTIYLTIQDENRDQGKILNLFSNLDFYIQNLTSYQFFLQLYKYQ